MRNLTDFIAEALKSSNGSTSLFKMTKENAQKALNLQDKLRDFVKHSKSEYSLTSKTDLEKMFRDFIRYAHVDIATLKEFNITSGLDLANLLIENKEGLEKDGWVFTKIKSFNETELEKQYKKWKSSGDYVEGRKFDKEKVKDLEEDELKRILVVYDVNDPENEDTTIDYNFKGKRGKDTDHDVNMIKMDWKYKTHLKYFDARPILLSNYLKKTSEELKKREITDDIIGKMD